MFLWRILLAGWGVGVSLGWDNISYDDINIDDPKRRLVLADGPCRATKNTDKANDPTTKKSGNARNLQRRRLNITLVGDVGKGRHIVVLPNDSDVSRKRAFSEIRNRRFRDKLKCLAADRSARWIDYARYYAGIGVCMGFPRSIARGQWVASQKQCSTHLPACRDLPYR